MRYFIDFSYRRGDSLQHNSNKQDLSVRQRSKNAYRPLQGREHIAESTCKLQQAEHLLSTQAVAFFITHDILFIYAQHVGKGDSMQLLRYYY